MIILAGALLLFWLIVYFDAKLGMRKIARLEEVAVEGAYDSAPLVSIIVAAKDEKQRIEESLQSQFKQTYRHIEWIVVNDRSTDYTGKIVNNLKLYETRLNVIHIDALPSNWLGKNHALYRGYKQSKGKYLLFTDADIIFHEKTIEKAVRYFQQHHLDHLTLAPNLVGKGFWTSAFVSFFLFGFGYFKRPWKANDPKSKSALGIGAFNLVKREAYEEIGTHEKIKMRPDDDLMLGANMKKAKKKQHMVLALEHLSVEWYPSLRSALEGLEKNTFAGLYYNYFMVVFAVCGLFVSQLLPFLALPFTNGITQVLFALSIAMMFLAYHETASKMTKGANRYLLIFPLTVIIFIFSIIRATVLTSYRGGIVWRGTFYSLNELKKNKQ